MVKQGPAIERLRRHLGIEEDKARSIFLELSCLPPEQLSSRQAEEVIKRHLPGINQKRIKMALSAIRCWPEE